MDRSVSPWLALGLVLCTMVAGAPPVGRLPAGSQSPLPTPVSLGGPVPSSSSAVLIPGVMLPPGVVAGLWVIVGVILGIGIVLASNLWYRRRQQ